MAELKRFIVRISAKDIAVVEGDHVRFVGGMLEVEAKGETVAIFLPGQWRFVTEEEK